jgi:hypothetical protein
MGRNSFREHELDPYPVCANNKVVVGAASVTTGKLLVAQQTLRLGISNNSELPLSNAS